MICKIETLIKSLYFGYQAMIILLCCHLMIPLMCLVLIVGKKYLFKLMTYLVVLIKMFDSIIYMATFERLTLNDP